MCEIVKVICITDCVGIYASQCECYKDKIYDGEIIGKLIYIRLYYFNDGFTYVVVFHAENFMLLSKFRANRIKEILN